MANTPEIILDFGNLPEYEGPYAGGSSVFVGCDGAAKVKVGTNWGIKQSANNSANYYFEGDVEIVDDIEYKGTNPNGLVIPACRAMALGRDSNGKAMENKSMDALVSVKHYTVEQAKQHVANKTKMKSSEWVSHVQGKTAWITFSSEMTRNGNPRTTFGGFIEESAYLKMVERKRARYDAAALKAGGTSTNGVTPTQPNLGGGADASSGTF